MGYRAFSSPPGRDRGIDLLAHPDSFGFERPHIKGQVKHRGDKVKGEEMRGFLGALKAGDNGLYISTGGFTSDAIREAEHKPDVSLLDRDEFINLLLEYYEKLEPEFQAKVPLRRVWIPTE
jgi:restriction system protein